MLAGLFYIEKTNVLYMIKFWLKLIKFWLKFKEPKQNIIDIILQSIIPKVIQL